MQEYELNISGENAPPPTSPPPPGQNNLDRTASQEVRELKAEISDLQEYIREIYRISVKTNRHLLWRNIMEALKLFVIIVALVSLLIYIRPYLSDIFNLYLESVTGD